MEITDISVTKVSTDSWVKFVEFPLITVMSKFDEYNNAEGGVIPLPDGAGLSAEINREALEHFAVE